MEKEIIKGYKGFDKDLKCRDKQYAIGETFMEEKTKLCDYGMHFCENPHDIFGYYEAGNNNRFCEVEALDVSDEREGDSKRVAKTLFVKAEISVFQICKIAVSTFFENFGFNKKIESADCNVAGYRGAANAGDNGAANAGDRGAANAGYRGAANQGIMGRQRRIMEPPNAGDYGAANAGDYGAANAGYCGAANAGDYGAANAGDRGANVGYRGAANAGYRGAANAGYRGAANAGYRGAANAGNRGAANAGYCGAANAGDYGAANAGDRGAANAGYRGAANAGDYGAANAGDYGAANAGDNGAANAGDNGVAVVSNEGKVKGGLGCILVARNIEYNDNTNKHEVTDWACAIVDGEKIKADTWYHLIDGELKEVKKEENGDTRED